MKIPHILALSTVLCLVAPAFAQERTSKPKPAPQPANSSKKAPSNTAATPSKQVAPGGAVVVKDWESGGGTRAAEPGDFPSNQLRTTQLTAAPVVTANPLGGIDLTNADTLMSTMVVTKQPDGSLAYGCKQGGDHSKHNHAKPGAPKAEVK